MTMTQKKMVNLGNLLMLSNSGFDIIDGLDTINSDIDKSVWIETKLNDYVKIYKNNPNVKSFNKYINMLKDAYSLYNNIIFINQEVTKNE